MEGPQTRRPPTGFLWPATILVAISMLSCNPPPTGRELTGHVVDVQGGQDYADQITVRDASGAVHTFRVSREVSPGGASGDHLRSHMVEALPVVVHYRNTAEGPLVFRVADAPTVPQPAAR